MRRNATAAALAGLSLLLTSGAATASSDHSGPEFTPGAPGIGDPYYPLDGNGGYDVRNYELDVAYDLATDMLSGRATITARATQNLSRFNLDFVGLSVHSASVNDHPAGWSRDAGELTLTPQHGIREGSPFTVIITYSGVPEPIVDVFGTAGFFHTDDGAIVVGQPDVAATWFPVNDHPLDKASMTFRITVPDGLTAVANGFLRASFPAGQGRTTWTWRAYRPMAPYLAVLAIGEFHLRAYRTGGLAYWDAYDPDLFHQGSPSTGEVAEGSFGRQAEIIEFLSAMFGPYPFRAAGGIVDDFDGLGFALETQTRPIYPAGSFSDSLSGDSVVVHELAHQWFGDSLALAGWQHIWLNEGFATYAEWLWSEREGLDTAQETFDAFASAFPAGDPFWELTIGDPGPEGIFDAAVYDRGAMTLHALRLEVGDETFFTILRRWYSSQRDGHVSTPEFIAVAETVSGRQLDELFTTWLFTPAKPAGLPHVTARSGPASAELPLRLLLDAGGKPRR